MAVVGKTDRESRCFSCGTSNTDGTVGLSTDEGG